MARPKVELDPAQVEELASIDCSYEEIARVLGCSVSTLTRRFDEAIKAGRARGATSLRRTQYQIAMQGSAKMLIWLGKNRLGQADKSELKIMDLPDEIIAKEVERRLALAKGPEKIDDPA